MNNRRVAIAVEILRDPFFPPSDRLPYHPAFEDFCSRFFERLGQEISRQEVWQAIVSARKNGLVGPIPGRRRLILEVIPDRHLEVAVQLLLERQFPPADRLPYTPEFDAFCSRFVELLGEDISYYDVWHAVMKARKRGLGPDRRSA